MTNETVADRIKNIRTSFSADYLRAVKKTARMLNVRVDSLIWLLSGAQRDDEIANVPAHVVNDGLVTEARFNSGSFFQYNRYILSEKAEGIKSELRVYFSAP